MTQRKQTKRRFSPEFKLEAIEQVIKYQQRAVDVAQSLDLDPNQLRKWIRQYEAEIQGITPAGVALIPDQRRIQELEKMRPHKHNGGLSPASMKTNGKRLQRRPNFVIHYSLIPSNSFWPSILIPSAKNTDLLITRLSCRTFRTMQTR